MGIVACRTSGVKREFSQRLPEQDRRLCLCKADFLKKVAANGQPTADIQITHNSLKFMTKELESANKEPDHHTRIQIESDVMPETMWCEVLQCLSGHRFLVRLDNDSMFNSAMQYGTKLVAVWD